MNSRRGVKLGLGPHLQTFLLLITFNFIFVGSQVGLTSSNGDPYASQPRISVKDGHLVFESASDRNINFNAIGNGKIMVNNENLDNLVSAAKMTISMLQAATSTNMGGIAEKINKLEQNYDRVLQTVQTVESMKTNLDTLSNTVSSMLGTGSDSALEPSSVSKTLRKIRKMEKDLRQMKSSLSTNECSSNPCQNGGTCVDGYRSYSCRCRPGWTGPNCADDVNECAEFVGTEFGCQNGGTCKNTVGSYTCLCPPDWKGIHCSQQYDDCDSGSHQELCGHGTCISKKKVAGQIGYKCLCDEGWKTDGVNPFCNTDIDECKSMRPHCSTNPKVDCINIPGSFVCGSCPVGFTGTGVYCNDIDECLVNNGGCSLMPRVQCINTPGSRVCGPCPAGYAGDGVTCSASGICSTNNGGCSPMASCIPNIAIAATYRECKCPVGYVGSGEGPNGCQALTGLTCSSNPCRHGTCVPQTTGFTCICDVGYTGSLCDVELNNCQSNPCKNGGRCIDQQGGFYCDCGEAWQGLTCETQREVCGGRLRGRAGRIKYPLAPNARYGQMSNCIWRIYGIKGKTLNIQFISLRIESSPDCSSDFLIINDGPQAESKRIGGYCGELPPNGLNITTDTGAAYIWFRSDGSQNNEGFELTWNTTEAKCGGLLDGSDYGAINSPGYPSKYPPDRDCYWTVKVKKSRRIQFHFAVLNLETHSSCDFDYLKIYDGEKISDPLLEKFCNSTRPPPVMTSGSSALVHFHSDPSLGDEGFHITYTAVEGLPGCGGLLTNPSGSFNSPNFPDKYENNVECDWLIRVNPNDQIKLTFDHFDLERHAKCKFDFVEVYDGPDENSPKFGRYCDATNRPPTPIISTGRTLFVRFRTDHSSSRTGIRATYETVCGGYFNSDFGRITSPSFPNSYPKNKECIYVIEVPQGSLARLDFETFLLENPVRNSCGADFLEVRDGGLATGTLLAKLCGKSLPEPIVASYNELWLRFKTDGSVQFGGFAANFSSVPLGCGGVFKTSPGVISTPNTAQGYPDKARCSWLIRAPAGFMISFSFTMFSIEPESHCKYDYVEIRNYDDTLIGRYCGHTPPPPILSVGNELRVLFKSDHSRSLEGFSATYLFKNASTTCGGTMSTNVGIIQSPRYPSNYPPNRNCIWTIYVDTGKQIRVSFQDLAIEQNNDFCKFDYLEIRNGKFETSPLIGKFCGSTVPKPFISHAHELWIKFVSDMSNQRKGFKLYYETSLTGCGGTLTAPSGTITSPNYPMHYNHDAVCTWLIHVSKGSSVTVNFLDLDIETSRGCRFDYLDIFDGQDGPRVAHLCKSPTVPPSLTSKSNILTIKFVSDHSGSARGFHLSYHSNCSRTLTGFRGVIESPNFPDPYPYNTNCTWNILAARGNNISLTFSEINLAESYTGNCSEYLRISDVVRDNQVAKYRQLAKYCGLSVPPKSINTTTNLARLEFITNVPISTSTFRLEWHTIGCGGEFLGKTYGRFTSPNYPNGYPHDTSCIWRIKVPSGYHVSLTVLEFDLEFGNSCNYDSLKIYGGSDESSPLVGTVCHRSSSSQMFSSMGADMAVVFHSDYSNSGKGFSAYFSAALGDCGGTFTADVGVFWSPNYPSPYESNDDCTWYIYAQFLHSLELHFEDEFEIPESTNCTKSFVSVEEGYGSEIQKFCGRTPPPVIRSSKSFVSIRLKADGKRSGKGFRVTYLSVCGGKRQLEGFEVGELTSPNYPHGSNGNENCNWTLVTKEPGDKIMITFTHLQARETEGCTQNFVDIKQGDSDDGPSLGPFCGSVIPPPIISSGNALRIRMHNNAIFRLTYSTSLSTCGGTLVSDKGTFMSPNYPNGYDLKMECVWQVLTSPGNTVQLSFLDFQVESSEFCNLDYVEVREKDSGGPLIGRFCGNEIPVLNTSAANSLWIKFRTDDQGTSPGFKATYTLKHGTDWTGTSGQISSPGYPKSLPLNKEHYIWTVTTPQKTFVRIDFQILEVSQASASTCFASVKIFDGPTKQSPELGTFCGYSRPPPLISTTNIVTILYMNNEAGRFLLNWQSVTNRTLASSPQPMQSNVTTCGETFLLNLTGPNFLQSPGYPFGYAQNLTCSWTVEVPPGYHIYLNVSDMNIEGPAGKCLYDSVKVFEHKENQEPEWVLNSTICDRSKPSFPIKSNQVRIDFTTDKYHNRTGFKLNLTARCGGNIFKTEGSLSTELTFGEKECEWTIAVRNGRTVLLIFDTLNLGSDSTGSTCGSTYLLLKNGGSSESPFLGNGKYCGTSLPSPTTLESTSNKVYIKFAASLSVNAQFKILYKEVSVGCGGNFDLASTNAASVTLTSPNYPQSPPHDIECDYMVRGPANRILRLDFDITSYEPGNITREFVEVHDGGTINSPLIKKLTVPPRESSLKTTDNVMFLRFMTRGISAFATFKATVSLDVCGGTFFGSAYVTSPNWPKNYSTNLNCRWTFKSSRPENGVSLYIGDMDLKTDSISDCLSGDYLEFREGDANGELIKRLCGPSINYTNSLIESAGNALFVLFVSNSVDTGKGFRLYISNTHKRCGGFIDPAVGGVITSFNFPNPVQHSKYCQWHLRAPAGRRIKVKFLSYNMKPNPRAEGCLDYVAIIKGPESNFVHENEILPCGTSVPGPVESLSNAMTIKFRTKGLAAGEGFKLEYSTEDEILCGGSLTNNSGQITSYKFGDPTFNESSSCFWTLDPKRYYQNGTLSIKFDVLDLPGLIDENDGLRMKCNFSKFMFGTYDRAIYSNPKIQLCGNYTGWNKIYIHGPLDDNLFMLVNTLYNIPFGGLKATYSLQSCGGFFGSRGGNFSSPNFPNEYPTDSVCKWSFNTYQTQFDLFISSFELEGFGNGHCFNDYVEILHGIEMDSPSLGKYCGTDTIAPIKGLNMFSVIFRSDSSGTAKGFSFEVRSSPHGCGGYLRGSQDTIKYPSWYESRYKNNAECEWTIEVPMDYHINFTFINRFDIEQSIGCKNDFILIQEWLVDKWVDIGRYCGLEAPKPFNSHVHKVRILFRSNDRIDGEGFTFSYRLSCGETFTDIAGYISSPGFPSKYLPRLNCKYLIQAPPGHYVRIQFDHFELEKSAQCGFDYVNVYKGNSTDVDKYGPFCGKDEKPPTLMSLTNMLIEFVTDGSAQESGFVLRFFTISCGGNFTDSFGQIQSPSDGKQYLKNLACVWNITVSTNKVIELRFFDFDLQYCWLCGCDYVEIIDIATNGTQTNLGKYCGSDKDLNIIKSISSSIRVTFKTNANGEKKGFIAAYRETLGPVDGCGGYLESESGKIQIPLTGKTYETDMDCVWHLRVPLYKTITLNFDKFDLEADPTGVNRQQCPYDYLEIRDGLTDRDPLIDHYCGNTIPSPVQSSGSNLYLHFHSDGVQNKGGFTIRFTSANQSCGGKLQVTNYTQTLKSPNWPQKYPDLIRCRWHFVLQTNPWARIQMKFTELMVPCKNNDFIEFTGEKSRVEPYRICDTPRPPTIIGFNRVWMNFGSGPNVAAGSRFSLEYQILGCNQTYDDDSGYILNDDYPFSTWNKRCIMNITAPPGYTISIYFHRFSFVMANSGAKRGDDSPSACTDSKMEVRDGSLPSSPLLATMCSKVVPNPVFSTSNQLTIIASSPRYFYYYLLYTTTNLGQGCGGNLTSINGTFTSPLYPTPYDKSKECIWYIHSLGLHSLTLTFTDFGFTSADGCTTNFVEVYNGLTVTSSSMIGRYCGQDLPAPYISDGNALVVRMVTSANNTGIGFRATFSVNVKGFGVRTKIITSFGAGNRQTSSGVYLGGL